MSEKRLAGVIGLGSMGMGAANSLLRAGFVTWACDVKKSACDKFEAAGGHIASSPRELGSKVQTLLIFVVNAEQTEDVLFGEEGAVQSLAPGSVVLASSTVAPAFAESLGERLKAKGIHFLDAPVSGGAAKAQSGEMTVMASGDALAFAAAESALGAIATKVYPLGNAPGSASKVKMINQLLAGVHIAAACEAMALGIKSGCDPEVLYKVICDCAGSSWMFQNRVPHILAGDYTPLSSVNIFVKDLSIVLDQGKRAKLPLPLSAIAHQMYLHAAGAGLGNEDDSSVIKIFPDVDLPKASRNHKGPAR